MLYRQRVRAILEHRNAVANVENTCWYCLVATATCTSSTSSRRPLSRYEKEEEAGGNSHRRAKQLRGGKDDAKSKVDIHELGPFATQDVDLNHGKKGRRRQAVSRAPEDNISNNIAYRTRVSKRLKSAHNAVARSETEKRPPVGHMQIRRINSSAGSAALGPYQGSSYREAIYVWQQRERMIKSRGTRSSSDLHPSQNSEFKKRSYFVSTPEARRPATSSIDRHFISSDSTRPTQATRDFSHSSKTHAFLNEEPGDKNLEGSLQRPENIWEHLVKWRREHMNKGTYPLSGRTQLSGLRASSADFSDMAPQSGMREESADEGDIEGLDSDTYEETSNYRDGNEFAHSENSPGVVLHEGDLVDFWMPNKPLSMGVIIHRVGSRLLILANTGGWISLSIRYVIFVKRDFLHPKVLRQVQQVCPSVSDLIENDQYAQDVVRRMMIPRSFVRDAMARINEFLEASNAIFRRYASRFDHLHQILADSGPGQESLPKRLPDLACQLLGRPIGSPLFDLELFTVNRVLRESTYTRSNTEHHFLDPTFSISSPDTNETIRNVKNWVRQYQEDAVRAMHAVDGDGYSSAHIMNNPLVSFVDKVRRIVKKSREFRPLSAIGTIGPFPAGVDENDLLDESFTQQEGKIIQVLRAWVDLDGQERVLRYSDIGPVILRVTGLYPDLTLGKAQCWTMLQEMNIVKPWQVPQEFYKDIKVPDSTSGNALTKLKDRAWGSISSDQLTDSMAAFRKDWGDLPVFCIDSASTRDRDDGISLEPVLEEPGNVWLHVHAANPSAFINPKSLTAEYAREIGETLYFLGNHHPMLPPEIVQDGLSLANNRPCITFSAKLSPKAEVLESKVIPGILRNVYHIDHSRAQSYLTGKTNDVANPESSIFMQIQGKIDTSSSPGQTESPETLRPLGDGEIQTLRQIENVAKAFREKRALDVKGPMLNEPPPELVYVPRLQLPGQDTEAGLLGTSQQSHDPTILIEEVRGLAILRVTDLVQECMLIAGQVCASWCKDRGIPTPYRGHARNSQPFMPPDVFYEKHIEPLLRARSLSTSDSKPAPLPPAFWTLWEAYMGLRGSLTIGSQPLEHIVMGLPFYCRATSPLRRFLDLVAHWQIEAALRYEFREQTSLVGRGVLFYQRNAILPFSEKDVGQMSQGIWARERQTRRVERGLRKTWTLQALHHALYFDQAPVPSTLRARIRQIRDDGVRAYVENWPIVVKLAETPVTTEQHGLQLLDVWEFELEAVNPWNSLAIGRAVKLISRVGEDALQLGE